MLRQLVQDLLQRLAREHGQALVLFTAGLAGFCGLVGMSIDVGQAVYTKSDLQKAADAAALAGAQDLDGTTAGAATAITTANSFVTKNGGASCQPNCSTVNAANDTITVTTTEHVDYWFLKVIGISGTDLHATAAVKAILATGFAFNNPAVFPYAVWGGNPTYGSCQVPYGLCTGDDKIFSSNQWMAQVSKNNPNWTTGGQSTANDFKGFFNTTDEQQTVYQSGPNTQYSFGGSATGKQPLEQLHQAWLSKTPIIVPVISKGSCTSSNCGTLQLTIVAWVALKLDQDPSAPGTTTLSGTIVGRHTVSGGVGGGYVVGGGAAQVMSATMIQ